MKSKRIYFTSLGCPRNIVDSEIMLNSLLKEDFELVDDISKADLFIVNTCGFLEESREEAYEILEELFEKKKAKSKVIVTGCMVKLFSKELKEKFSEIYSLITPGDIDQIVKAASEPKEIINKPSYIPSQFNERRLITPPHVAYLKIAEGCSKACTFCIIPQIKGALKSREEEDILEEFKNLLKKGVYEIILIAQDLGDFQKDKNRKNGLVSLIKKMLMIKQDFWLRLLYVYPDEMTDELISLIKSDKRICRYIDMPIQHINNDILKKMRRKTSKEEVISIINKLRKEMPDFIIRTSLMVGFPSESDEQFDELLKFVKEYKLDNVGIFKFSKEKFAKASSFDDQIEEKIKEKRFKKLSDTQLKMIREKNKKYINNTLDVIIEGYHPESDLLAVGRSQMHSLDIDGAVIINNVDKIESFGSLHQVKVVGAIDYDLIATII